MTAQVQPDRRALYAAMAGILVLLMAAAGLAVIPQDHAFLRHGDDAATIRRCLDDNGAYQTWAKADGTFYQVCKLPDGRWGLQAIIRDAGRWVEKTAFVKGDGSWSALTRYLTQFATRWTGPLP